MFCDTDFSLLGDLCSLLNDCAYYRVRLNNHDCPLGDQFYNGSECRAKSEDLSIFHEKWPYCHRIRILL